MGEQMAKRDWPFGGPQSRLGRGIKAFEYAWSSKSGQNVCNLVVERKLALSTSCMAATEVMAFVIEAIQNTVGLIGKGSSSECCLIDNFVARRHHRDHTRPVTTVDCGPESLVHL
jgi:hypothetical protein